VATALFMPATADASDETATPASAHSASPQRADAKSPGGITSPSRWGCALCE